MPQLIGYIIAFVLMSVSFAIGAVFGCFIAIYNYCCSFIKNVNLEKI
jgi:hypothetical protein